MSTSTENRHPDLNRYNSGYYKDYNCDKCGLRLSTRDYAETVCRLCRAEQDPLHVLTAQLESQASTLARVVGERDRLREALQGILTEAEFVGDAKAPFSTWIAERVRRVLTSTTTTTGQEEG